MKHIAIRTDVMDAESTIVEIIESAMKLSQFTNFPVSIFENNKYLGTALPQDSASDVLGGMKKR